MAGGDVEFSVELGSEYDAVRRAGRARCSSGCATGCSSPADSRHQRPGRRARSAQTRLGVEQVGGQPDGAAWRRPSRAAARRCSLGPVNDQTSDPVDPVRQRGHRPAARRPGTSPTGCGWSTGRPTAPGVSVIDTSRDEDRAVPVDVPGITGDGRPHFLVSRDGTRLVAVVHGRAGRHACVVSRIRHDALGRVAGATRAAQPAVDRRGRPADPRHRLALADQHRGAAPAHPGRRPGRHGPGRRFVGPDRPRRRCSTAGPGPRSPRPSPNETLYIAHPGRPRSTPPAPRAAPPRCRPTRHGIGVRRLRSVHRRGPIRLSAGRATGAAIAVAVRRDLARPR